MASFLGQNNLRRGIRNNNPGNIKRGSSAWKGKIPFIQSTDTTFEQFTTVEYGIRAMMVLVSNYYNKNGLKTVSAIIKKWAPAGAENPNQTKYINHVVNKIPIKGLTATTPINVNDKYVLLHLVLGMCEFENGVNELHASLDDKHFYDAYDLFKGNTTANEIVSGVATPQSGKIGSILTIVGLVLLTVIAFKS